jgi:hypothetical protein
MGFAEELLKLEIAQESALHSTPGDCESLHLERTCAAIKDAFTFASMVSSRCYRQLTLELRRAFETEEGELSKIVLRKRK